MLCILHDVGNSLTESDLRILNIVLAEHLPKLKESGLSLDYPHTTKEEVVTHLQKIDQHEFAEILSETRGKILSIISICRTDT